MERDDTCILGHAGKEIVFYVNNERQSWFPQEILQVSAIIRKYKTEMKIDIKNLKELFVTMQKSKRAFLGGPMSRMYMKRLMKLQEEIAKEVGGLEKYK